MSAYPHTDLCLAVAEQTLPSRVRSFGRLVVPIIHPLTDCLVSEISIFGDKSFKGPLLDEVGKLIMDFDANPSSNSWLAAR